ncbi:Uncharacterized protein K02A2.6, partial [Araneus ventricosus]
SSKNSFSISSYSF